MAIEKNVGYNEFPNQGNYLGKKVEVCFRDDASKTIEGEIVRDDTEEPYKTIIQLSNGRYILSTECQYSPLD